MKEYEAKDKSVKASGMALRTYLVGLGDKFQKRGENILKKHGVVDLREDGFYPMQSWLDAMKEIHGIVGDHVIFKMGTHIPTQAKFPPEINSAHMGLGAIDIAYHMNHTEGDIGHYAYERVAEKEAKVICTDPYPCDFDRGIVESMAKMFEPKATVVCNGKECRKKGGDQCTYTVKW